MISFGNDDIKDENEKAFELNAKPLTIFKSPLIGAKWMPYATQLIRWESFNMPSDYINIYISKDNGKTYEFLAENLKKELVAIQYNQIQDRYDWTVKVD